MEIAQGTLEDLATDKVKLEKFFRQFAEEAFDSAKLHPIISERRVHDAHLGWCRDLVRVPQIELDLSDGLDHFKRCGHLTYWLRRSQPLIGAEDKSGLYTYEGGSELTPDEAEFRELLWAYGNEYLAFDLGVQFCRFYELDRGGPRANMVIPTHYIQTICNFLKFKNVGPDALFLVFRSLFLD